MLPSAGRVLIACHIRRGRGEGGEEEEKGGVGEIDVARGEKSEPRTVELLANSASRRENGGVLERVNFI